MARLARLIPIGEEIGPQIWRREFTWTLSQHLLRVRQKRGWGYKAPTVGGSHSRWRWRESQRPRSRRWRHSTRTGYGCRHRQHRQVHLQSHGSWPSPSRPLPLPLPFSKRAFLAALHSTQRAGLLWKPFTLTPTQTRTHVRTQRTFYLSHTHTHTYALSLTHTQTFSLSASRCSLFLPLIHTQKTELACVIPNFGASLCREARCGGGVECIKSVFRFSFLDPPSLLIADF